MSAKPRKRRGLVLTVKGEQKLLAAITQLELEHNAGDKLSIEALSDYAGLDPSTVSKVLACEKGCDRRTHATFFSHLGLALQESDVCRPEERQANQQEQPPAPTLSRATKIDWGEAADVPLFFGRTKELDTLKHWITVDGCRLVAILGMGGMGKTALAVKLAEAVQAEFDYVIWRSLREAPQIEKTLTDLIKFLSDQQATDLPDTVGEAVTRLMHYLQQSRCLLVLDNVESILQSGTQAGKYREGYESYETLIQRVGESRHQGCLVLTSREKPRELAKLEGPNRPVRTLPLMGLEDEAGLEFLLAEGLTDSGDHWKQVVEYYSGNPLALKIAANSIQELFGGNIAEFLAQGPGFFSDIRDLLEQQFERLPELGQSVMYWLAINREATPIEELKEDILEPVSTQELLETLEALKRRSLVERSTEGFTLQNVVIEYATNLLVNKAVQDLKLKEFGVTKSHSFIKATGKDYVRSTQIRLIVQPVVREISNFSQKINSFLEIARADPVLKESCLPGNLLNILLQFEIENYGDVDFSRLRLKEVYLRGKNITSLDFSDSHFEKCSFSQACSNIYGVDFSPSGDFFAIGDTNGTVQLYRTKEQKQMAALLGHRNRVRAVSFSPDGKLVASCSEDSTIRIWEVESQRNLYTFEGHISVVRSIAFSPDSRFLASSGVDCTVRIWDIAESECIRVLHGHSRSVMSVSFSPNGKLLASGSDDSSVRVWEVNNNFRCIHRLVGHSQGVLSVKFSPDSCYLASGSEDSLIKLWDLDRGHYIRSFEGNHSWVWSVDFSKDGRLLASGGEDCTVRIWNLLNSRCTQVLTGHTNGVISVAFSPNNHLLISGGYDASIRLWDTQRFQCIQVLTGHSNGVWSIAINPSKKFIASGSSDSRIRFWDNDIKKCIGILSGHTNGVWSIAFSPDSNHLISGSYDHTIRLWDIRTHQGLHVFSGHHRGVRSVAYSPDGKMIASGSDDRSVRLWDVHNRQCTHKFLGHDKWVISVAFSPNGKYLASSSNDSTIRIWDIQQKRCLKIFEGPTYRGIWDVTFSPDSQFKSQVVVSEDSAIRIWDLQEFVNVYILLNGHTNFVCSVAFE
jgi:WD40 repeat protein